MHIFDVARALKSLECISNEDWMSLRGKKEKNLQIEEYSGNVVVEFNVFLRHTLLAKAN